MSSLHDELPLTESTLYVMLCLRDGPKHGYAILKIVEDITEGRLVMSTGTLYGIIKRTLDKGWITRMEDLDGSRDSKVYALTDQGHQVLDLEIARLQSLIRIAERFSA